MIEFIIHGQIKSGKNHMQVTRSGRHYPLRPFAVWRDKVVRDLRFLLNKNKFKHKMPFTKRCILDAIYWPGDKRKRDVPGLLDALFHCFEKAGLVADDSLIKNITWITREVDKQNPRCEIRIEEI